MVVCVINYRQDIPAALDLLAPYRVMTGDDINIQPHMR